MKNSSPIMWIPFVLIIVGAVNWGLVGLFHLDLVATLFGAMSMLSRIVYIAVGVSGVWSIFILLRCCKDSCGDSKSADK